MVLSVFAFAYLFGGMVPSVSGQVQGVDHPEYVQSEGGTVYELVESPEKAGDYYKKYGSDNGKRFYFSSGTDGFPKEIDGKTDLTEISKQEAEEWLNNQQNNQAKDGGKSSEGMPPQAGHSYTVKDGETLTSIAGRVEGVGVDDIVQANDDIQDPDNLKAGQNIQIPPRDNPSNKNKKDNSQLNKNAAQANALTDAGNQGSPFKNWLAGTAKGIFGGFIKEKSMKKLKSIFDDEGNLKIKEFKNLYAKRKFGKPYGELNEDQKSKVDDFVNSRKQEYNKGVPDKKNARKTIEKKGGEIANSVTQETVKNEIGNIDNVDSRERAISSAENYFESGGSEVKFEDLSDQQKKNLRTIVAEKNNKDPSEVTVEEMKKQKKNMDAAGKENYMKGAKSASGPLSFIGNFVSDVGKAYGGATGGGVAASSYIFASASAALAGAQLYKWTASLLGAGERNLRSLQGAVFATAASAVALQTAIEAGALQGLAANAGAAGFGAAGTQTAGATGISVLGSSSAFLIYGAGAIAAMGAYTLLSYQLYSQHTYEYQVSSWQPEFGGERCTECNELRYGCSEYQCHTFGRACELVNKGSQQERCVWKNKDDIKPPVMSPMNSSLENNQEYRPMDTQVPADRGVQIVNPSNPDGCLPAFSGAEIGVKTNELAECKIDINRKESYKNMTSYFSQGTTLVKNHTLKIPGAAMPSESAGKAAGLQVENGKMNRYYAQCKDVNGNPSPNNLVVGFCVEEGPDTQPPVIEGTNYLNESFISNNQTTVPLEVYTNEPATCRWSRNNLGYSQMNNNLSDCSQNMQDYLIDSSFQYGCSGNVTGVKSGQENNYYIKCKDKPWLAGNQSTSDEKRIENKESFELTLEGTEPLVIRNITVNGRQNGTTIRDATDSIRAMLRVETAAGAERGKAKCRYTIDGSTFNFYNNGTTGFVDTNSQELYLSEGNYNVPIQCNDAGGNVAQSSVTFTIDEDNAQPQVTRTYRDEENLRVLTSEGANCVYNTNPSLGCTYNFDDGVSMKQVGSQTHYVEWDSSTRYYVKCSDEFGNRPAPDQCSVTVRAYNL
ncbi:MAG: LysM peptidoglycan-binding domain-containing protein [Candidatus Paceibacteria bacterium]